MLFSLYLYLFRFGPVAFISLHPKYKWEFNEENVKEAGSTLEKFPTYMGKTIVLLSPKFKETDLYASAPPSKEAIPVDDYVKLYHGQWKKYGPFDVLEIYIDIENFNKVNNYNSSLADSTLSSYINFHFIKGFNLPINVQEELGLIMSKNDAGQYDYIYGIDKR